MKTNFSPRIEKKFIIEKTSKKVVEGNIKKLGFEEIYKPRIVNSLYYDTFNFNCYKDSEEGIVPRKKYRVRNYNSNRNYQLDIKYQNSDGRYKKTEKLSTVPKKIFDSDYGWLEKKVYVNYYRKYFSFSNIRLTFDYEIKFQNLSSYKVINNNLLIIELKNLSNYDKLVDEYTSDMFNLPFSSFSKYEKAVETIFNPSF
jgi:hypothetical protein